MPKKDPRRGKGAAAAVPLSLEGMLTGSGFADLDASPVQLAIARAAEGKALDGVIARSQIESYFGVPELPDIVPKLVVLICGVRSGKSFIAACAAIVACLRTSLAKLKKYEVPRFAIIGPTVDAARATFVLLLGILRSSPVLSRFIEGDPSGDTVMLKRPDGRRVEICVVAAARGGATIRNRWLVGFILEEVAQIGAEVDGKIVNAEELLKAAMPRLLKGATGWVISSPFGPQGLLHELWKEHFGKPGRTLVAWVPTLAMNPSIDPVEVEALRHEDPDAAAREYDALWTDQESSFLSSGAIDRAIRPKPLERLPRPGVKCFAAQDPATRGNAWTLVIGWPDRDEDDEPCVVIAGAWQWIGTKLAPLSPRVVFREIATILDRYDVTELESDQWSFDSNVEHARGRRYRARRSEDRRAGSGVRATLVAPGGRSDRAAAAPGTPR